MAMTHKFMHAEIESFRRRRVFINIFPLNCSEHFSPGTIKLHTSPFDSVNAQKCQISSVWLVIIPLYAEEAEHRRQIIYLDWINRSNSSRRFQFYNCVVTSANCNLKKLINLSEFVVSVNLKENTMTEIRKLNWTMKIVSRLEHNGRPIQVGKACG